MWGTATPFTCPPGFLCSNVATTTFPGNVAAYIASCPSGQFCGAPGASAAAGSACPNHHYCPPGSSYAQKCPTGTIRTTAPSTYAWDCVDVAVGKVASGWGQPDNVPIQKGYMYPGRTSYAQEFPCPPGTYGDAANHVKFNDCK